jgi:outer membrane lipoprotein carrier protein
MTPSLRFPIALFSILLTFVLSSSTQLDIEKKAKDILDKVSKTYKNQKSTYAEFAITTENKTDMTVQETAKGKLWVKNDKFKIQFDDQIIWCNGKVSWTYYIAEKELSIENYTPSDNELGPGNIFTFYKSGFLSKFDGSYKNNQTTVEKIAMTPTDKKKPYFLITLHVQQDNSLIKKMLISFKNGIKQEIVVSKQSADQVLDAKFFEFDASQYKVAHTDDLRD